VPLTREQGLSETIEIAGVGGVHGYASGSPEQVVPEGESE